MKLWLYTQLTDMRDSSFCPEFLANVIDWVRYLDYFDDLKGD